MVTLSGLTIQNGQTFNGGGFWHGGTLYLTDSTVSGNRATNYGGAINNEGGELILTGSTLISNTADNDGPTILDQLTKLAASVTADTSVSYTWDFGDGKSGSRAVVNHTYDKAGTFTAKVTVSNPISSPTATTTVTVKADVYIPIVSKEAFVHVATDSRAGRARSRFWRSGSLNYASKGRQS